MVETSKHWTANESVTSAPSGGQKPTHSSTHDTGRCYSMIANLKVLNKHTALLPPRALAGVKCTDALKTNDSASCICVQVLSGF